MNTITTILLLSISTVLFSQNNICEEGTFYFNQKSGEFHSMLTKKGNVFPLNNVHSIFTLIDEEDQRLFKVKDFGNNTFILYNNLSKETMKISYTYDISDASLKLCYLSFIDQITPLVLVKKQRSVTILSENNIPVITFSLARD